MALSYIFSFTVAVLVYSFHFAVVVAYATNDCGIVVVWCVS
jgi:hypothetical protein